MVVGYLAEDLLLALIKKTGREIFFRVIGYPMSCFFFLLLQGAPEGILERCKYVRVDGTQKVDLTPEIKEEILDLVRKYGTGEHRVVNVVVCESAFVGAVCSVAQ